MHCEGPKVIEEIALIRVDGDQSVNLSVILGNKVSGQMECDR